MLSDILIYFPTNISQKIYEKLKIQDFKQLEEIRIRVSKPIILKFNSNETTVEYIINNKDILDILQKVCDNSIYTYQKEICSGYITVKGGHRIGLTGSSVLQDNKVININYISSLNFRIARQILGCSNIFLKDILDLEKNTIYNTIIVSVPGAREDNLAKRFNKKYK